ncbi:hypothetical protein PMAYCL1PPCAC_05907, partial [Pristionchus mayeri]
RIVLPFVNSVTVHPLMLLLLYDSKTMASDIRLGYLLTEIALIAYDWIFNFLFRIYPITPYAGFYCGGPGCRLIENRSIFSCFLSSIITANIPCFLFLVMRTHKKTSFGLKSTLNITNK